MYSVRASDWQFTAGQAAKAAGVEYHHVNHWCKTGLLKPSIREAVGTDSVRVFSFGDVVAMAAVGHLRTAGLACESLKAVVEHLQGREYKRIADGYLVGGVVGRVRELNKREFVAAVEASKFTWILDLAALVQEVDQAAGQRVKATRGRASLVA